MNIMNKKAQSLPGIEEINIVAIVLAVVGCLATFWYVGRFYDVGFGIQLFTAALMLPIGYFVSSYIFER